MAVELFILLGVVFLWVLPGLVSATICLVSGRLRERAFQLSRHALRCSVEKFAAKRGVSPETVWQKYRIQDSRAVHLAAVAVILTLSGPLAWDRLRDLARARSDIRLE